MKQSERLIYRKFEFTDLETLVEMRSDEDVMKYIGGRRMQNPESLRERLKFYISCYSEPGMGLRAMLWKENNKMIGWSGLQPLEDTGEIEVSYGMIKDFWGMGLGFEAAHFWLTHGFEVLGLERIVAVADKANTGSWKIMEKVGMTYEKSEVHYEMDCVVYAISAEEFQKKHRA